jgi:hypothetical protein
MDLAKGQSAVTIDAMGDPQVRAAVLINIAVEAFVALATLALMFSTLHGVELESRILKRLRIKLFGPPAPSEQDIERYARLAVIEAMKIVREANE